MRVEGLEAEKLGGWGARRHEGLEAGRRGGYEAMRLL